MIFQIPYINYLSLQTIYIFFTKKETGFLKSGSQLIESDNDL